LYILRTYVTILV